MSDTKIDLSSPMEFEGSSNIIVPITIGDDKYQLREAGGDAVIKHKQRVMEAALVDGGKMVGLKPTWLDVPPKFLACCLFKEVKGEWKPVSELAIRNLDPTIVDQLYERARVISKVSDEEKAGAEYLKKKIAEMQAQLAALEASEEHSKN